MTRLFFLFLLLMWASPAHAADDLKITARAEPDRLPPGSELRLVITVEGEDLQSLPDPKLPRLKDFEIVGKSESHQVSIVNFDMKVTKSIVYRLLAPREGEFEIGPVTITAGGKTCSSQPVKITVDSEAPEPSGPRTARRRPGSIFPDFDSFFRADTPPHAGRKLEKDDLFATMEVDKTKAVPFERIIATFSFYRAVDLWEKPGYGKPDFKGFWAEDLPFPGGEAQQVTQEEVNGKKYNVTRMRYALYPISEGEKVVDSARVTASVDPWSDKIRLATSPILINVRPFPPGAPDSFNEMTGGYEIESSVEPRQVRVNDSVTLRLVISGDGYLKSAPPPRIGIVGGFELFDPRVTGTLDKSGGSIVSEKVVEYPMIAREEGEKTVPSISVSWFDPASGKYVTRETEPVRVDVLPPLAPSSPAAAAPSVNDGASRGKRESAAADGRESSPLSGDWRLWLIALLPFPVLAAGWALAKRRRRLPAGPAHDRAMMAAKIARASLAAAKGIDDPREFFAALDNTMRGYLAARWNVTTPSIGRDMVREKLGANGDVLSGRIIDLLDAVEYARFAPSAREDMEARLSQAREIIGAMERF